MVLAYKEMFKNFAKVICLEDDIIVNKNFIKFTTFYLNTFEFNKKIMNITGFSTKIKLPKNYNFDCYTTRRSMSWDKHLGEKFGKVLKLLIKKGSLISY